VRTPHMNAPRCALGPPAPSSAARVACAAWLRHAEIKHGRIAMAGFVGFMASANYETVGAPMKSTMFPPIASGLSAPEVWDAIPFLAKLQIIGAIGVFEHISEDKNLCAHRPARERSDPAALPAELPAS
jgi:hypothetical protein